ncbi:anti-sigma factor [Nesterenkonia salmonea]|uniref:Anti-sigma factor n=1 Tax=Nesterenkonia salmonea TaxID=1804987 RepID=A0A5R9BB45_9MICC|nr:anti-sigma factor [Nesterenkonia salmonea]TLP96074.1 anti-sigma factor [Nesterenkonia salmonea]
MTEEFPTGHGSAAERHLSDEILADLAYAAILGETAGEQSVTHAGHAEHLIFCTACREALDANTRVLRALQNPVDLEEPPPELWDRIAAELDADSSPDEAGAEPGVERAADSASTVHYLPSRKTVRWWVPMAAAAAGLLIGGAAVAGVLLGLEDEEEPPPVATTTVIGEATLEPVAADEFSGEASMVETEQGTMEITVEITSAPEATEGYFELWLRDEDASRLHSLGAVSPGTTTIEVPTGIDLGEYPVVDVSHEHFDGDPGHGGVTLAAGAMEQSD